MVSNGGLRLRKADPNSDGMPRGGGTKKPFHVRVFMPKFFVFGPRLPHELSAFSGGGAFPGGNFLAPGKGLSTIFYPATVKGTFPGQGGPQKKRSIFSLATFEALPREAMDAIHLFVFRSGGKVR